LSNSSAPVYYCQSFDQLDQLMLELEKDGLNEAYFMGGEAIYREASQRYPINQFHLTQVFENFNCDTFLSPIDLINYDLVESEPDLTTDPPSRYQVFQLRDPLKFETENKEEKQYQALLTRILKEGQFKIDRTKVGTLSIFGGAQLRFDLTRGFPLLTTKSVFWRGVVQELFFFLKGQTDAKILQNLKVHIWDDNSTREYLDKMGLTHYEVGDLGPIYGFQWKHFNAEYVDCHHDYTGKGIDQIQQIIDLIKSEPVSRRIILSAWNPSFIKEMALPPCHVFYQFSVDMDNHTLSCSMYMRSSDTFLGLPFNIASTALLTQLIAKTCDLKPGHIILTLGDSHIYRTHLKQVAEQLSRTPDQFPQLEIKRKKDRLEDYELSDLVLTGYKPQSKLSAPMAV
jgi:thymidylate synthase